MMLVDKVPVVKVAEPGPAGHLTVECVRALSYALEFIGNGGEAAMTFHLSTMQSGFTSIMAIASQVDGPHKVITPLMEIRTKHLFIHIEEALSKWLPRQDWGQTDNLMCAARQLGV